MICIIANETNCECVEMRKQHHSTGQLNFCLAPSKFCAKGWNQRGSSRGSDESKRRSMREFECGACRFEWILPRFGRCVEKLIIISTELFHSKRVDKSAYFHMQHSVTEWIMCFSNILIASSTIQRFNRHDWESAVVAVATGEIRRATIPSGMHVHCFTHLSAAWQTLF